MLHAAADSCCPRENHAPKFLRHGAGETPAVRGSAVGRWPVRLGVPVAPHLGRMDRRMDRRHPVGNVQAGRLRYRTF